MTSSCLLIQARSNSYPHIGQMGYEICQCLGILWRNSYNDTHAWIYQNNFVNISLPSNVQISFSWWLQSILSWKLDETKWHLKIVKQMYFFTFVILICGWRVDYHFVENNNTLRCCTKHSIQSRKISFINKTHKKPSCVNMVLGIPHVLLWCN